MIWAVMFACAISFGWAFAWFLGGKTERETMLLLTATWLGTLLANLATGFNSPFYFYACLDVAAVYWLYQHQRENWQWVVAGLFSAMLLSHIIFWSSAGGLFNVSPRSYQDTLAVLGYLQIISVVLASGQKWRARRGAIGNIGRWALSNHWVLVRRHSYAQDEG